MLKKLFSLLIIYSFTMTLLADEATVQADHVNSSSNSSEDQSLEKLICFETRKSIVFEDYFKTLPDEAKAEIQAFIKKVEQALLSNNVFVNLLSTRQ